MDYEDIFSTNPIGLSMGVAAPTVNRSAAIAGAGASPVSTGMVAPTPNGISGVSIPGVNSPVTEPIAPTGVGFFAEGGMGQFGLGAIQVLGSLWNSFQQNKLAKEAFNFQKDAFNINLENQEQSYNTALEDRINARYVTEGKSQAEADAYIQEHSL